MVLGHLWLVDCLGRHNSHTFKWKKRETADSPTPPKHQQQAGSVPAPTFSLFPTLSLHVHCLLAGPWVSCHHPLFPFLGAPSSDTRRSPHLRSHRMLLHACPRPIPRDSPGTSPCQHWPKPASAYLFAPEDLLFILFYLFSYMRGILPACKSVPYACALPEGPEGSARTLETAYGGHVGTGKLT